MKRLLLVIFVAAIAFLLFACNRGAAPEEFVDPECGSENDKTFENWSSWTKVNPMPLLSEGHAERGKATYVDVCVDDLAKAT